MYNEWQGLNATQHSPTLGRDWLLMMGEGAEKANVTVQYCMTMARMVLQSAEIPGTQKTLKACYSAVRWKHDFLAPTFLHP